MSAPLTSSLTGLPKVTIRCPDGAFTAEVYETLLGDPHWAPLDIADLLADLTAIGWGLADNSPPEPDGVDFVRFTYENLRVWVDGRQVTAATAVAAMGRGLVHAVTTAARHEAAYKDTTDDTCILGRSVPPGGSCTPSPR